MHFYIKDTKVKLHHLKLRLDRSSVIMVNEASPKEVYQMCGELLNGELFDTAGQIDIHLNNYEKVHTELLSKFERINAAGGVVVNTKGEYLMIYRLDKWDLPKGKIEKGELIMEAAVREVEEECGILPIVVDELKETWHSYMSPYTNRAVMKCTYWFLMKVEGSPKLTPQTEEGITEVRWMSAKEVKAEVFKNTYPSVKEVFEDVWKLEATEV